MGSRLSERRSASRLRVLVVEDHVPTRVRVVGCLAAIATIDLVATAVEARNHLAQRGRSFDLAVVSCRASDRGEAGVELITALRRLRPLLPVIAMVSSADEAAGAASAAARQGACEVLRRPLDIDELRGAVGRALPAKPLPGRAARSPLGVTRVLAFLSEHVGQHVSLAALAGIATMSRSHLSRTFRSIVGIPLRTYVHDLRLERARQMLLARRPPSLTDVALEAGFYDLPHFDKAFRERFGLTPSEFVRRRGLAVVGARRARRRRSV